MLAALKPYNKAIMSAVIAGLLMFFKDYLGDHTLSLDDWEQILGAMAAGGGLTWAIPNVPKPADGGK